MSGEGTLEDASLGDILYVSPLTKKVTPWRRSLRRRLAIMPGLGIALLLGIGVLPNLFGTFNGDRTFVGVMLGMVLLLPGLFIAWLLRRTLATEIDGSELVNEGRYEEAERALAPVFGLAPFYAARLATMKGDHAAALEGYREAIHTSTAEHRQDEARHFAILSYCNLDRTEEASALLASCPPPTDEYNALLRRIVMLYIDLSADQRPRILEEEVHVALALASRLRGTWGLFALLAYARPESRARWIAEERKRKTVKRIRMVLPKLWTFMRE